MENEEIKPCPFCGGNPTWRLTKIKHCQLHGEPLQDYILGCQKPHCPIRPSITHHIKEWCIKNWNTRN